MGKRHTFQATGTSSPICRNKAPEEGGRLSWGSEAGGVPVRAVRKQDALKLRASASLLWSGRLIGCGPTGPRVPSHGDTQIKRHTDGEQNLQECPFVAYSLGTAPTSFIQGGRCLKSLPF